MRPGLDTCRANIGRVQRVQGPVLPDTPRPGLTTEDMPGAAHQVYFVLRPFFLLQDMDSQGNLMLAGRAAVERVFAGTEVAMVGKVHAVFVAVAVLYQRTNF